MAVSVLMSVYKNEDPVYFTRAMSSIWDDQILKPKQIVLVIDGPVGKELYEQVDYWKKKISNQLDIINLEQNVGLTKALNIGIGYCRENYIARMDTDDIATPNRFDDQVKYLDQYPEVYVLGGGIHEIDEKDNFLSQRFYPHQMEMIKKYLPKANPIAHPTVMLRSSLFKEKGFRYDQQYRKNQDLELWFRVVSANIKVTNLPQIILYFRRTKETYRKRKSFASLKTESRIYIKGIYLLYGVFTWRYIYPVSRFLFKLLPVDLIQYLYDIFVKNRILKSKKLN